MDRSRDGTSLAGLFTSQSHLTISLLKDHRSLLLLLRSKQELKVNRNSNLELEVKHQVQVDHLKADQVEDHLLLDRILRHLDKVHMAHQLAHKSIHKPKHAHWA